MANGINGITGGGSGYGIGGSYVQQKREQSPQEAPAEAPVIREETQVDGNEVFRFLEANAPLVNKPETTVPVAVSEEVAARVAATMPRFEQMMALLEDEFGSELAPFVLDATMDAFI